MPRKFARTAFSIILIEFAAFGIQDPRAQMEDVLGPTRSAGITKELERLEVRVTLRSVLEQVLNAYLRQDDTKWDTLPENQYTIIRRDFDAACALTYRLFHRRYATALKWDEKKVREQVAWGCYPLHPITTAACSSISFSATRELRSVLRFVEDTLKEKVNEDILVDGRVNWTLPYELVDYFREGLAIQNWTQYEAAVQSCGGDISEAESRVLKSILLIAATSVPVGPEGYVKVTSAFTGLAANNADETLKGLASRAIIQHESHPERYVFFTVGSGTNELDRLVKEYALRLPPTPSPEIFKTATARLEQANVISPIEPNTKLGPLENWTALQIVVPFDEINKESIVAHAARLSYRPDHLVAPRGIALWSVPLRDDDVELGRIAIQGVLDAALKDSPVPIMVLHPNAPMPGLIDALQHWSVLNTFSPTDREKVGKERFNQVQKSALEKLAQQYRLYQAKCAAIVPQFARATLPANSSNDPSSVLDMLYKRAFADGPGPFFPDYKMNSTAFNPALSKVAPVLATNTLRANSGLYESNGTAKTLIQTKLRTDWKIISAGYSVEPPKEGSRLSAGWNFLENNIRPGKGLVKLGPILTKLLNPPFGYDERSLMMLFTAWWGVHRYELDLSISEGNRGELQRSKIEMVLQTKGKNGTPTKPDEFVKILASSVVERRDDPAGEADEIVRNVRNQTARHSIQEANEAVNVLRNARDMLMSSGKPDSPKLAEFMDAVALINKAKEDETLYSQQAGQMSSLAGRWQTAATRELVDADRAVSALTSPKIIVSAAPDPEVIRAKLREALTRNVEYLASENESLKSKDDHKIQEVKLRNLSVIVSGFPEYLARVEKAKKSLESNHQSLMDIDIRKQSDEKAKNVLTFTTTNPSTSLVDLRSSLARLEGIEEGCSQPICLLVEKRREHMRSEIAQLETRISGLAGRLDEAREVRDIMAVRDETLSIMNRVGGSVLEDVVADSRERAEVLGDLLRQVEAIQFRSLASPEDAASRHRILEKHVNNSAFSAAQQEGIQRKIVLLNEAIATEVAKARSWLDGIVTMLERKDNVHDLKRRASDVPPFLDATGHQRLAEITMRIEASVNADRKGKIQAEFQQITDIEQQRELAESLFEQAFGYRPTRSAGASSRNGEND